MGLKEATWYPNYLRTKELLEKFVTLEQDGAEAFRQAYPNFAPRAWWDYRPVSSDGVPYGKLWRTNQRWLREEWSEGAWSKGQPMTQEMLTRLSLSVFDPANLMENLIEIPSRPYRPHYAEPGEVDTGGDYYELLIWLNSQPWRAKVCEKCGKYFIASNGKRKFCSVPVDGVTCGELAIRATHRESNKRHPEWKKSNPS